MKVYLDDFRTPLGKWKIIRSFKEFQLFIHSLNNYKGPLEISFDYELEDEYTGYDCAMYMTIHGIIPDKCWVHSAHKEGGDKILQLLTDWYILNNKKFRPCRTAWPEFEFQ
jgi:hypothetical protein